MNLLYLLFGVPLVCLAIYWFEVQVFLKFKYKFFSQNSLFSFAVIVMFFLLGQNLNDHPKSQTIQISSWFCYAVAVAIAAYVIYRNFKNTNGVFGIIGSLVQGAVLIPAAAFGLVILLVLCAVIVIVACLSFLPTDDRTESEKKRDEDDEDAAFDAAWNSKDNKAGPNYEE